MKKLRNIYRKIVKRLISPVAYAKKIGVNFHENELHIYGNVVWGSEPWLIKLGKNVHITNGVKFLTHDAGILIFKKQYPTLDLTMPIEVGNDVYIGTDVLILPGVKIGSKVIIGAGSIISRNIPDNSVVVGVPGKVIKSCDEYLEKAIVSSTNLGYLEREEKDKALMEFYHYKGNSSGIYF